MYSYKIELIHIPDFVPLNKNDNTMLNVVIIDDEKKAIDSLEWELKNSELQVTILGVFTKAADAVSFVQSHSVDCIFLDVEMPGMDGFSFLSKCSDRTFSVIFTTAFNEYAINAIKERALDYLLKPIDSEDLNNALLKAYNEKKDKILQKLLEDKLLQLNTDSSHIRISIPIDGKLIFIDTDEIIYCESQGNYSKIYLENGESYFLTKKLKFLEELLPNELFFRIHNSFVIGLHKVRAFYKNDSYVLMTNKKKIPVSVSVKLTF